MGSRAPGGGLREEIGKRRPFDSPEQEAWLNLVRTASVLGALEREVLKPRGLTGATYNVLRILRGAMLDGGPSGRRTCRDIGAHLIARVPDVTRLVDRLVALDLVRREPGDHDRRVVYVRITRKGLDVLARLDAPILDVHARQLGHLSGEELAELSRLLTRAREPHLQEGVGRGAVPHR